MTESVIIRPTTVEEVVAAVRRAHHESLPVTVVAGGHGPWSHGASPGLRIELSELSGITIEGTAVHVSGGAVWGDVAAAIAPHGLAISSGDTATVGVGGLTLGGGIGWMVRSWGLAVDQLVGAQVVTATGEVVEASATENADLFWALRGPVAISGSSPASISLRIRWRESSTPRAPSPLTQPPSCAPRAN